MDQTAIDILIIYGCALIPFLIARLVFVLRGRIALSQFVFDASMVVFLPGVGVLLLLVLFLFRQKTSAGVGDYGPEIRYVGTRSDILYKSDVKTEKNIVPIEEALLLNDNKVKRRLLIEALKMDFFDNIYSIKKAIADKDTETSHYAAAALMELKSQLTRDLQSTAAAYEKNKENADNIKAYGQALKRYLQSEIGDKGSRKLYKSEYLTVLEKLVALFPGDETYFTDYIEELIENREYRQAEKLCNYQTYQAGAGETPFLLLLKVAYLQGQRARLDHALSRIRNSNIKFSEKAVNSIRFWIG